LARILDVYGFEEEIIGRNVRFTAPELMPMDDAFVLPTCESDIFSLGILLLQLFHGPDDNKQRGLPYNHFRFLPYLDIELMLCIIDGERPIRDRYYFIEDHHWRLICKCWAGNPDERPTIEQVQEEL